MESRKIQLQKQIIEALKANDNDLYSLLKAQWAHRFGVESLEELNNLDLKQRNQDSQNLNNQKIEQSKEKFNETDKPISMKDNDQEAKQIKNIKLESINDEIYEDSKTNSNEIVNRGSDENKSINQIKEKQNYSKVQVLIPIPPKPRYSYLKKWLVKR